MKLVGIDLGFGNSKIRDERGQTVYASHIARPGTDYRTDEGKKDGTTCLVEFDDKRFVVGHDAPIFGDSLPGLDTERILGSDEICAATYAALGAHMTQYGRWRDREGLTVYAGIPASLMIGDDKDANVAAVKGWLTRKHSWLHDGREMNVVVENVVIISQAAGAFGDMAYTLDGKQTKDAQYVESGFGVISIGYNTVETSGGIDGKPIRPMIGSKRMGVSKLLSEYDRDGKTELSALDRKLRQNQLNGHLPSAINTWAEAIVGHVAEKWEKHLSQIGRIVLVGGGARYAEPFLRRRFGEKIWIPDEPIVAIARGLYKRAVYDGKK
mgnify:CR=1 FL=1